MKTTHQGSSGARDQGAEATRTVGFDSSISRSLAPAPRYWRSLEELADTPAFRRWVESEFPALVPGIFTGPTRRQILKVMGAAFALGGLTGCRWPKEAIVPATRQPGNRTPGVPVQYATAMELGGVATGLLVTSYDGRPIKIEGNPQHPFSRGKSSALLQATILDLYDPDRSQRPTRRAASGPRLSATWDEFEAFARQHFAEARAKAGAGLAVLSGASSSPSVAEMRARLAKVCPQAVWVEYEAVSRDNERDGARLAFGRPYRSHLHLDRADVIVAFDHDFLMLHPAAVCYTADFAARRRADDGRMNRLVVFESNLTVTGSMADHRFALRPSQIGLALEQVAAAVRGGAETRATALKSEVAAALAADLLAHKGRCLVTVGPGQPPEVHALAHALNETLGAHGTTITFTEEPDPERPSHIAGLRRLAEQMQSGAIQTLVILGGNPAWDAPADVPFAELLARVPTAVHLGLYADETAQLCLWHVPQAHYLEAWGDARAYDGTVSIIQPLVEPLFGGKSMLELLALLTDDTLQSGYEIVRRTFGLEGREEGGGREGEWQRALHDGVVANTAWPVQAPAVRADAAPGLAAASDDAGWELCFAADYRVYDGRFANNAWLQEFPDPITKLTWDNAALLSPAAAQRLGVKKYGDVIRVEREGQRLEIPAYILPGHADGCLTLPLGYGRGSAAGVVADGAGVNVYPLRTSAWPHFAAGAQVTITRRHETLATTQDHHAIRSRVGDEESARRIPVLVREATLEHYRAHPDFAQHVVHLPQLDSLWTEKEYKDHKWGMAIDLSACVGCGACVVACQAENNIPVVGKAEVALGREMHWIRVDRYFREGTTEDVDEGPRSAPAEPASGHARSAPSSIHVVHQPMTCVHCELAPCEQVCPVAATVHDEEGLNVMVYNRCIGTRYCANNCPFKVRRFNWFYNHHGPQHPRSLKSEALTLPGKLKQANLTELERLQNNPNVTVRSRGVMEKCTFCVQRISAAKIRARNEKSVDAAGAGHIPDGTIVPACAQACPADAIVFGDLNDPNSRVRKLHEHNRAYALLAELNIKPRTMYLARLSNPANTVR